MQLSVIILNYNVRPFLEQCVLSVQKAIANIDAEIIVVDNNSEDDSCSMMKHRFPEVTLIENNENTGFPKGNNIGVAAAIGKYICILNPDTVIAEDTFTKVLAFAEQQSNLGIIGVKLVDGTGNFLPESKRGVPTPFVAFTKISGLYKLGSKTLGKYYANHLTENQTGKVDILVGAFMLMERELYLQVGGFDEDCFMYSDDIDLSYMILKLGKSNYYFGETSVIHYKGESTVKDETYMRRFRDAMNFFYRKHFQVSRAFDIFMKSGTFLFSMYKKTKKSSIRKPPNKYYLVSSNSNRRDKVENLLGKTVSLLQSDTTNGLYSLLADVEIQSEIIFDNGSISFKSIIEIMELYSKAAFTFKILPEQSDFLIGSNSRDDRGEVIGGRRNNI